MKLRVFLHYYFKVLIYNLELTGIAAIILAGAGISSPGTTIKEIDRVVLQSSLIFLTAGTAAGFYLYHIFKRFEYPFYYNAGFRVPRLIVYTIALNTIVTLCILAVYFLASRFFR